MIRPDCLSSSCARWTSRRTETPAPIGIAWISAVAFMGLEVKGLTWYRAALTAAYHAGVRPPSLDSHGPLWTGARQLLRVPVEG